MGRKPPLATKSLDNIFARQLTYGTEQGSPFLWQDATRSEEQLYHAPHTFSGTSCSANKASRLSGARFVEDFGFTLYVFNFHRRARNVVLTLRDEWTEREEGAEENIWTKES
jgi:hypothetical protein